MLTSDWTPEAGYLPPAFQRSYDAVQDGAGPQDAFPRRGKTLASCGPVPSLGRGGRRYRINRLKARGQTTATGTGLPSLRAGSQSGQLSKNSSTA